MLKDLFLFTLAHSCLYNIYLCSTVAFHLSCWCNMCTWKSFTNSCAVCYRKKKVRHREITIRLLRKHLKGPILITWIKKFEIFVFGA